MKTQVKIGIAIGVVIALSIACLLIIGSMKEAKYQGCRQLCNLHGSIERNCSMDCYKKYK